MQKVQSRRALALSAVLAIQCMGAISYVGAAPQPAEQIYSLRNRFGMAVTFERKTGRYWVSYQGQPWFGVGDVSLLARKRWYRSGETEPAEATRHKPPEGSMTLEDARNAAGSDRLGAFDSLRLSWKVPDVMIITSFRLYRDAPYLVFGQEFPEGYKNYASGDWTVPAVAFPHFIGGSSRGDLYSWVSEGMDGHRFGYGSAFNLDKTVDLLLVSDRDYNTIILSPFAIYLVATQQSAKSEINCGIEGLVEEIPVGFKHEHIMVAGTGIGTTFRHWGEALLTKAGKKVPSKYQSDIMESTENPMVISLQGSWDHHVPKPEHRADDAHRADATNQAEAVEESASPDAEVEEPSADP